MIRKPFKSKYLLFMWTDIDECLNYTDNKCEHNCTNTPGSFKCTCRDGFHLATNGQDCIGKLWCVFVGRNYNIIMYIIILTLSFSSL